MPTYLNKLHEKKKLDHDAQNFAWEISGILYRLTMFGLLSAAPWSGMPKYRTTSPALSKELETNEGALISTINV